MANMMDYLDWRGDITFAQSRFNEVDNLILSQMCYAPFEGIVSEDGREPRTLSEVANQFFLNCVASDWGNLEVQ